MQNSVIANSCSRRVLSCARCRRRKTRCDRALPVCSQCAAAKAQCSGVSTVDSNTEVPRSLVQFLESYIAQCEIDVAAQKKNAALPSDSQRLNPSVSKFATDLPSEAFDVPSQQHVPNDLESSIICSSEVRAMVSALIPSDPALTDLVSRIRMGLTPSLVLPVVSGQSPESRRVPVPVAPEEHWVNASTLATLPEHVLHSLVRKFVRGILPQAPIMQPCDLEGHLNNVLVKMREIKPGTSTVRVEQSFSFLIIYLVLAISSTLGCAKSQHESRCIAFSEVLFREGIFHLSSTVNFPTDLAGLQSTLLILQYAEINPKAANIWILNGSAMRSCLELGLHREPIQSIPLDDDTLMLRRQVFWTAYCMDRAISPAMQKPMSIPDSIITAQLPIDFAAGSDERQALKQPNLRWIEYCRIQSETIEIHFQGRPLNQDWNDWLGRMEATLGQWYHQAQSPDDATEFAYAHGLMRLHRPSPRMPMPSTKSLLSAFEAACRAARYCREPIISGFVRKLWLAAHHMAESAMVAIFCLRHASEEILNRHNASEVFESTKVFTSNLLTLAASGWPEISKFAADFERLLAPLLNSILIRSPSSMLNYPHELEVELNTFLLPGPTQKDAYFGFGFSTTMQNIEIGDDFIWDDGLLESFETATEKQSWDGLSFGTADAAHALLTPFP